jgi:hypothetical protein
MRRRSRLLRAQAVAFAALALGALACAGCVSAQVQLIGHSRPPVSRGEVQLYLEPPALAYEEIALLGASSKRSFAFGRQDKADVVIERLKEAAAKLGANGVLLREIADGESASLGAGVGTEYQSARGTVDLGVGVGGLFTPRYGRAVAIYLPTKSLITKTSSPTSKGFAK